MLTRSPLFTTALASTISLLAASEAMAAESDFDSNSAQSSWEDYDEGDSMRIVGGGPVKSCNFPNCAVMGRGRADCSGTLIHPRVITTAGHCIGGRSGVKKSFGFGDHASKQSQSVTGTCKSVGQRAGSDWAYCILEKEVTGIPIVPVLMGCEVDALKKGQEIMLVGYGNTRAGSGGGPKRQVLTPISAGIGEGGSGQEQVHGNEILLGHAQKGACGGDSGGPAYIDLRTVPEFKDKKGAGWRVFGMTSRKGPGGGRCASTSVYSLIHKIIPRIEKDLGEDATPCFDADGTWNPTEDCKGFPDPEAGGSWPNCEAGTLSGYSHTCGDNKFDKEGSGSDSDSDSDSEGKTTGGTEGTGGGSDSEGTSDDSTSTDSDSESGTESEGSDSDSDTKGGSESESESDSDSDSGGSNKATPDETKKKTPDDTKTPEKTEESDNSDSGEADTGGAKFKEPGGCSVEAGSTGQGLAFTAGLFALLGLGRRKKK